MMMKVWVDRGDRVISDYIVSEKETVLETMNVINKGGKSCAFVCEDGVLLAVVTDGDIRRHIISEGKLSVPISTIANYHPIYVKVFEKVDYRKLMRQYSIIALPVVDESNRIVRIEFWNNQMRTVEKKLDIPVVIMAGGKGTRLKPYTQILPKPLIPIGEKTITERIMEQFERFGCNHFELIVNYKKNFIISYFQDCGIEKDVSFIEEKEFLGTAGGLRLLRDKCQNTFFMTNCDIIVNADYAKILDYHRANNNMITLVGAHKKVVIPYGTINTTENGVVTGLTEKPEFDFITNTGLYVIEPGFLEKIPADTFVHITDVIQQCVDEGEKVGSYLVDEDDWLDMGQLDELEKMKSRLSIKD